MSLLWFAIVFAAGYASRHFDVVRFHPPKNPLLTAAEEIAKEQEAQVRAEMKMRLRGSAERIDPQK